MQVIPALDLRGGRVVRLRQGDFASERAYSDDPAAAAAAFAAAGAARLHVVDLDAVRGGAHNRGAVAAILDRTPVAVQVAGGIGGALECDRWLEAGAAAVVMGTTAVRRPELLRTLAADRPGRVLAALDVKAGRPAVRGWTGVEEIELETLLVAACGGDPTPDDAALHQAIVHDHTGTEVTFDGTVLADPTSAPGHEHIEVRAGSGDVLEIDHNVGLARPVPAHTGDQVIVHG